MIAGLGRLGCVLAIAAHCGFVGHNQNIAHAQSLTSLVAGGVAVESGGLRFGNFAVWPEPGLATIDQQMLESIEVEKSPRQGYGGLTFRSGAFGTSTIAGMLRRSLMVEFEVESIDGSAMRDMHLTLRGASSGDSLVGVGLDSEDISPGRLGQLLPVSFEAFWHGSSGATVAYSARRAREAVGQVMTRSLMYLVIVADSDTSPSSATFKSVTLRVSNGQPRLAGDYDLNASVDGGDFLLWQRTFGDSEELVADGSFDGRVDAADYTIWRDNFGTQIGPPGDFDGDGDVDGADFLKWQRVFGSSDPAADANGDGIVDAADYTIWRDNFGAATASVTQSAAAIPEPSTGFLTSAGLAVAAALWRIRRKGS